MEPSDSCQRPPALPPTRTIYLNAPATGVSIGIVCGLLLGFITLVPALRGGAAMGPHLSLLAQVLPGYRVSYAGAALGLLYGLLMGGVLGYCGARLYNRMAALNRGRSGRSASMAGQSPGTPATPDAMPLRKVA